MVIRGPIDFRINHHEGGENFEAVPDAKQISKKCNSKHPNLASNNCLTMKFHSINLTVFSSTGHTSRYHKLDSW